MKVDVTIEVEIDEPDVEKSEHWAEDFVEKCLHHIPTPYVEEYAVSAQPYVKEVSVQNGLNSPTEEDKQ